MDIVYDAVYLNDALYKIGYEAVYIKKAIYMKSP